MNIKKAGIIFVLIFVCVVLFVRLLLLGHAVALFDSQGVIAAAERNLIIAAASLMLIVGIPIISFAFYVAWKYREHDGDSEETSESNHKHTIEIIWWGIPITVVAIIASLIWIFTHALDPYKPIASSNKPLTIQVVALRWKWLFLYPDQHIATVNFIQFPVNTPVNFQLTADAPMNSFWIPQLSGQMYAMAGMGTQLHMMATHAGDYNGSAAEINGEGFSGMKFIARASSQSDFSHWVYSIQQSPHVLTVSEYNKLVEPSTNNPAAFYYLGDEDLYNKIIIKFMVPGGMNATPAPMEINGTKVSY